MAPMAAWATQINLFLVISMAFRYQHDLRQRSRPLTYGWPLVATDPWLQQGHGLRHDSELRLWPDVTIASGVCADFSYLSIPHCPCISSSASLHSALTAHLGFLSHLPHLSITHSFIIVAPTTGASVIFLFICFVFWLAQTQQEALLRMGHCLVKGMGYCCFRLSRFRRLWLLSFSTRFSQIVPFHHLISIFL